MKRKYESENNENPQKKTRYNKRVDANSSANKNYGLGWAAERGDLQLIKYLITFPDVDPTANSNAAIRKASANGHLEVVKFLCTIPIVDPTDENNFAIRWSVRKNHLETANYLASLPCYNPFEPGIPLEIKKQRFQLLTELKLESNIHLHRIKTNKNLSFLFFNDPNSTLNNQLHKDEKEMIVKRAVEFENCGLI